MSVTAAVAQFAASPDKQANRKLAVEAIEAAVDAGAELVVLPENSMYADPKNGTTDAEPLDGEFAATIADTAKANSVTVIAGMTERLPDDTRPSNTLIAVDSRGTTIGVYRKVHLYDAFGYRESDRITPAAIAEPVTFDLGGLRFAMMTCYDLRFPEMARYLVDAGATAIALPAAWLVGPAKENHWQTLVRARAIENTCYVLAAGQTGPAYSAQSLVADPMGTVLGSAGEAPGHALATLSADRIDTVRATNPSLANRRFRVIPA
ncbi:MAG TPA: carbon-nitrogen hydrolase family protein [Pseudonocardiaceae bacterium]|nr:carbon-nitrogen hydrolase family protein [Pseudonocardiaceae bacterium]